MSRLIDADALKRKAQKVATEAWKMRIKSNVETILNQFIDWIDAQPTITPEPQWVPCSERLPENNCQCIVTAKVKHVDGYPDYEVDTADYTDGIFTTANDCWWGIESIIAWMPLPECYQGEQKGAKDEVD